jgi:hypothetical protein
MNACTCPHCANPIEFCEESSGLEAPCPHCSGMLTLPEYAAAAVTHTGEVEPGHPDYPDNRVTCPKCGVELPILREHGGKEAPCFFCNKATVQYPEFNDDLLGVEEHQFFRVPGSKRSTIADSERSIELTVWHFLVFVLLVPLLWMKFRNDEEITSPIGMAVGGAFGILFAYFLIHGVLINGIKKWCKDRRTGKIEVTPAQTSIRMGDTLDGRIQLELKEPMNPCSVGVSMELIAYKGVMRLIDDDTDRERTYVLSCCRAGQIIDSHSAMNAGSRHYQFSIEAPIHQAHTYEKGVLEMVSWEETRFRKKTSELDAQTLLSKVKLQWVLHIELIGEDGVILRSANNVEVSGGMVEPAPGGSLRI